MGSFIDKIRKSNGAFFIAFVCLFIFQTGLNAQDNSELKAKIFAAMKKSTEFMADNVSTNGGYLSHYLPDMSRRWGEMEAYPTMIWVQDPGTVSMGNTFLDEYEATHDEYYYKQAEKAAKALIWGQLACGGWNYLIDFGGEKSLKKWYATYGKNAWRLEEFQHYYGNGTFDDETTDGVAFYLLRFYLTKMDPAFKAPLDKVIDYILKSQYPLGGWPQRYPLMHSFNKSGHPDYTSYYTFNDNVVWENVEFLIACYATLGENRFLDPIRRGMYFYKLTQGAPPQAGWGQQYNMDLKLAAARTYEPASYDPQYTARHIEILIKFYKLTGDRRFIEKIPDAVSWLKSVIIPDQNLPHGFYKFPKFVEPGSNKPLFTHRIGSNVDCGHYYYNYDSKNTVVHYNNFRIINLAQVEKEYGDILKEDSAEVTDGSPLKPDEVSEISPLDRYHQILKFCSIPSLEEEKKVASNKEAVEKIINSMDSEGRWLVKHQYTSNPYFGSEKSCTDPETKKYSTTYVGDKYDTSPYPDKSGQEYISTAAYSHNIEVLLKYLNSIKLSVTK